MKKIALSIAVFGVWFISFFAGRGYAEQQYDLIDLGANKVFDINNSGQIAGQSDSWGWGWGNALLWENGTMQYLPVPEGTTWSRASSINNSGRVAGWSYGVGGLNYMCQSLL